MRTDTRDGADIRFKISAARRILFRQGCDSGIAGHVSVRVEGEPAFWITPFEYFDETMPDRVAKVGFDLTVLDGELPVSPAIQFHSAIYRSRPDVASIIHTHSRYVSVISSRAHPIGMYNVASVIFHNDQAVHIDDGTRPSAEGDAIVAALSDRHVLLMKNHGAIVVSDSLENATVEAVTLELAARYEFECRAVGGTELPEAEILASKPSYDKYYRPMMWEANLRRLRRSDPDLFR
jgi:L-fuculose-phosphate aldolase